MRRFLIVDDNISLAENVAEIIACAGAGEAVLAESGVQALGLAAKTRFDALVSDVRMPDMNGIELFQRMRLVDPGLPTVFMTAYAIGDETIWARQEGILCILPKPVPIVRLLDLLAHACRDGVSSPSAPPVEPCTVTATQRLDDPGSDLVTGLPTQEVGRCGSLTAARARR